MCECGAESEDMDWSLRAVYSVLASLLLHISGIVCVFVRVCVCVCVCVLCVCVCVCVCV